MKTKWALFTCIPILLISLSALADSTKPRETHTFLGFEFKLNPSDWNVHEYAKGIAGIDFLASPVKPTVKPDGIQYISYSIDRSPKEVSLKEMCEANQKMLETQLQQKVTLEFLDDQGHSFCRLDRQDALQDQFILATRNGGFVALNLAYSKPGAKLGFAGLKKAGFRWSK